MRRLTVLPSLLPCSRRPLPTTTGTGSGRESRGTPRIGPHYSSSRRPGTARGPGSSGPRYGPSSCCSRHSGQHRCRGSGSTRPAPAPSRPQCWTAGRRLWIRQPRRRDSACRAGSAVSSARCTEYGSPGLSSTCARTVASRVSRCRSLASRYSIRFSCGSVSSNTSSTATSIRPTTAPRRSSFHRCRNIGDPSPE